ncbi:MAG: T9SS type A sorting domain-containing protein [Bacteroidia bacterium]|nr:T9SS type A sorting domain-containing protein [Bacteroidia bacterium]
MKKRAIFFALFCYVIIQKGVSQNYFSKRIDIASKANTSFALANYNDTIYVATTVFETEAPYTYSACLLKMNSDATINTAKRFKPLNYNYTNGNQILVKNNKFYLTGLNDYGNEVQTGLYVYNKSCDTILTRGVGDTAYYNYSYKITPFIKTKDKLLLFGVTDSTCGPGHQGQYKSIIRVVDTNGVLYQTKLYLNNCFYRNVSSVDTSENKGYLVGYAGMFNSWDAESRVMKLDSNLNVIWDKQINITAQGVSNVVNHKNQYYMVLSTIRDSVWNFSYHFGRVSLTKLNINGSTIWQKYFGVKERPILTSGLKECFNGDYIMCGTHRTSPNELQGWIMRTDSIGNLKWWRNYRPQTSPILDTLSENYLHDIIELPNGDIAAVGWSSPSTISSKQQTWLLKLDSNGCFDFGNCNPNIVTGIGEIDNTSSHEDYIKVSPNPFSNNFKVSYALHNENNSIFEFNLTELATGKIIARQSSFKNQDTITFNTEDIASGVYIFNVRNNGKNIKNIRIINIK